jgi:ABC-type taurine transport system ATPase subunit
MWQVDDLAGAERAASIAAGEADLDGTPIGGPGPQCAMVFQEDALLPWRSARRNVEFALAMRGVRRGERRAIAMEMLRQVGLDGFADHLPGRPSGGTRQRVQLARTLAAEPVDTRKSWALHRSCLTTRWRVRNTIPLVDR